MLFGARFGILYGFRYAVKLKGIIMKSIRAFLAVTSLFAVISGQSAASTTGSVTGTVSDSITGNPATGVNVRIEGTAYESRTGEDGTYKVQNIPPGIYRIIFEIHPERRVIVEQVMVVSGHVTSLNVEIGVAESVLPSPDTPVLMGSGRALRRTDLDALPAANLVDALAQSSPSVHTRNERASYTRNSRDWYGVASSEFTNVNGWDNMYVRGGDEFELGYRINGWPLQDPFTGEWLARLPMAAVCGLSLRTSGIGADVENFSSGILDVYGLRPTSAFQTSLVARTDAAASTLGATSFGQTSCSATSAGPLWKDKIGYAVAVDWLNADDLEPGIYGSPKYRIVDKPYYTGYYHNDSVAFDGTKFRRGARSDRANGGDYVNAYGMLTFHPARDLNIETTGLYSYIDRNVFFDPWATSPQHAPHSRRSTSFVGISGDYRVEENLHLNARIGHYQTDYEIADRMYSDDIGNDLSILQTSDSTSGSLDNFGLFRQPRDRYDGYEKQHSESWTMNGSARFLWMENHVLEAGLGMRFHALRYFNLLAPYPEYPYHDMVTANSYGYKAVMAGEHIVVVDNNSGLDKAPHPLEAGAYVSHDFVSEYFSTSLGLRYDVFDFDQRVLGRSFGDDHQLDSSDFSFSKANGEVSYRVGIVAHTPHLFDDFMSIRGWINYERFVQAPPYELLYAGSNYLRTVVALGVFGYANNWNAKPMVTRQFEAGYTAAGSNSHFSMLYYDRRQHNAIGYMNTTVADIGYKNYLAPGPIYRATTGWELSAGTSWQSVVALYASVAWMDAEETTNDYSGGFISIWTRNEEMKFKSSPRWQRDRVETTDLSVVASKGNGLLSRTSFLESLTFGLTYQNKTGTHYTPIVPSFLDFYGQSDGKVLARKNSASTPSSSIVNLKFTAEKRLLHSARLQVALEILNLLNSRTIEDVFASSGSARTDGYLYSNQGQVHATSLGPRFVQQYQIREKNAFNYGPPREVRLSVGVKF